MSLSGEVVQKIGELVGEGAYSTASADIYTYGFDSSIHHQNPDIVVRPSSTEQVSQVLHLANDLHIPVVPRGAGTGLCGGAVPIQGGIVLDLSRMNKILEVRVEDLLCVCEAGVVFDRLGEELAKHKFAIPTAPGSSEACTIGGMVATNASGMRAIKYGAMRDYVLGLEVVLAGGEVIQVGNRTLKNSSGYQLERLFVGSEGTLGVITKATLRIAPKAKKAAMIVAAFPTLELAGKCVSRIIAKPIIPSAIELMDSTCIKAVNKTVKAGFPDVEALCMIEVDGEPETVEKEAAAVRLVCQEVGATSVEFSADPSQMAKWTYGRKSIMSSLSRYGAGWVSVSLADDMAVPISKIPDAVVAIHKVADSNGIVIGTYGHAADGNLHTKMLLDPTSADYWQRAEKAVGEVYESVLGLGGTVTGEHGVGISKAPYMHDERSTSIHAMLAVKRALDPNNILNPGKVAQWQGSILTRLRYPCDQYRD
ncbi:MAG TPA: FAD-binding oxidoreductase [Methanomassiliicoccales archaeon]|nr:FAD-binding oxidoreductase [Methanomassiliicoccales archaeon]